MSFDTLNGQIVEHNSEKTWKGHSKRKSILHVVQSTYIMHKIWKLNFWYQCTSCQNEHQTKKSTNEMEHPLIATMEFN